MELLKKCDSDEDLYAQFSEKQQKTDSCIWGNVIDQIRWKNCVIDTSNIIDGKVLVLYRLILFTFSVWIVTMDHHRTQGLNWQKYTIWGEVSTCISLFLLLTCAILKFAKDVLRVDNQLQ